MKSFVEDEANWKIAIALLLIMVPSSKTAAQRGSAPAPVDTMPPASSSTEIIVPRGTEIALVTTTKLSSEKNAKGDLVRMTAARDVIANGLIVVPEGAEAVGELTRVRRKGAFGAAGRLEARMLYVIVSGSTYRLGGKISVNGRNAAAEAIATGIAVGALAFVVTGRRAEFAAGTAVTAHLDRDERITLKLEKNGFTPPE